jgi:acyl carrier protein
MPKPPPPTRDEVEPILMQLLGEKAGRALRREESLALLDLDSLAMAEFSVEIERALAIRLDEGVLEPRTVGELIDYVAELKFRALTKRSIPSDAPAERKPR